MSLFLASMQPGVADGGLQLIIFSTAQKLEGEGW